MRAELRRGLTLLELIAALALSGAVIVAGAMLLDQANDATDRIAEGASQLTRAATGARLLRALLYAAELPRDSSDAFSGDDRHAEFITRCPASAGWLAPCRATLGIDSTGDSTIVRVDAERLLGERLGAFAGQARFRYVDPLSEHRWTREWRGLITLPAALAIVAGRDTIVFPVGGTRD
jgi:prepilin-type N-terminal cleavage/methylation domain-containing protein